MKKYADRPSLDGVSLRRRTVDNDQLNKTSQPVLRPASMRSHVDRFSPDDKEPDSVKQIEILPRPEAVGPVGLKRADISESLKAVDEETTTSKPNKKFGRNRQRSQSKSKSKPKSKKKIISLVIVGLIILGVGYFAFKVLDITGRMVSGNIFDLLGSGTPLKQDANGRTNIVVFGTSEDDPGHDGADLTDSILVVSLDQTKKDVAMVSMPRDMWVDYGTACPAGYSGKINAVYSCYSSNGDENAGAKALGDKVGEVFGLDVQYFTKINYTVVRELTTALGGVTVNIDSPDSRGIYDYNTKLKLPNGPATLQGEQALAFVRARGDGGGYGFEGSNFAREQNQQKMTVALLEKSLSAGTLANPVAVDGMLNALGNNIRTNFTTGETKTLINLAQEIDLNKITSISLVDEKTPVVTTGMYNGQSIVRPIKGIGEFSGIQGYIQRMISGGDIMSEDATIEVLNGSNQAGVAAQKQTELTQAGLLNITTGNTSFKPDKSLVWYDTTGGGKPKTQAKLASLLGGQPAGKDLPDGVVSSADFVIIIGSNQ